MADNLTLNSGSGGATLAADDISGTHHQRVKVQYGVDGSATDVSDTNPLPIDDAGGSLTVDNAGTFTVQVDGDALTALQTLDNYVYVDDADWTATTSSHALIGGIYQSTPGSITDGDTGPLRLDANGAVHINDGGNSITIDGTVTANAGTGTFTVDGSGVTQPVSGTVTANLGATDNAVLDQIEVNTSYGDNTGGGTEAGALRVTVASDTTGVLSVDDNGGSLTVDGTVTADAGTGTFTVGGVAAENAAASGNPVLTAGRYDATPRTLGDGDAGAISLDVNGHLITSPHADSVALVDNVSNSVNLYVDEEGNFAVNASFGYMFDGSTWDRLRGDATNGLLVNLGTNNDVTLNANSGVDIGDVDVLTCGTITPGTAAANLGKAQDTAVGATDTGVALLLKRDDEQAAVTPIDGDYVVPTCDRFGKVKITELPDATSEVKYAVIDAASNGDNTIQAAAGAGIKIRVLSVMMISAGTVTARFESGAGGTALTGQMNLVVNTGFTLPYNPHGWFETADNALLNLELSAAVSVDGCLTYVEV